MLGRYQSILGSKHWKSTKKVMQHLQGDIDYILAYKHIENLEVARYSNFDFTKCVDIYISTSGYIFLVLLISGAISWEHNKQPIITSSTM